MKRQKDLFVNTEFGSWKRSGVQISRRARSPSRRSVSDTALGLRRNYPVEPDHAVQFRATSGLTIRQRPVVHHDFNKAGFVWSSFSAFTALSSRSIWLGRRVRHLRPGTSRA